MIFFPFMTWFRNIFCTWLCCSELNLFFCGVYNFCGYHFIPFGDVKMSLMKGEKVVRECVFVSSI